MRRDVVVSDARVEWARLINSQERLEGAGRDPLAPVGAADPVRDLALASFDAIGSVRTVYERRSVEAVHRCGHRLARRIRAQIDSIPAILAEYATFPSSRR